MALSDFYDQQRIYQASVAQVREKAQWREPAGAYSAPMKTQDRKAMVKVDPNLSAMFAKSIAVMCPEVAKAFEEHMGPYALQAFKEWPVKSGLSKSQLDLQYRSTETDLRAVMLCNTPYAYMIREKKLTNVQGQTNVNKSRSNRPKKSSAIGDKNKERWLKIAYEPARARDSRIWKAATYIAARRIKVVTYGGVQRVYERIRNRGGAYIQAHSVAVDLVRGGASMRVVDKTVQRALNKTQKKKKSRGKRVADTLIFKPAEKVATDIANDIGRNIARKFTL